MVELFNNMKAQKMEVMYYDIQKIRIDNSGHKYNLGQFCRYAEGTSRYVNILSINARLEISGGYAKASGEIKAASSSNKTSITVKLQRQTEVGKWITVATWTDSGNRTSEAGGTKSIDGSYRYRTYAYGKVLDSNGNTLETATDYSGILP